MLCVSNLISITMASRPNRYKCTTVRHVASILTTPTQSSNNCLHEAIWSVTTGYSICYLVAQKITPSFSCLVLQVKEWVATKVLVKLKCPSIAKCLSSLQWELHIKVSCYEMSLKGVRLIPYTWKKILSLWPI